MWRVTWRNLFARKLRLLLSAFAIVLGVAFVAGSFVLTDTIRSAFTGIVRGSTSDVEIAPTGSNSFTSAPDSRTIPESVVDRLRTLSDAAASDPGNEVQDVFVLNRNGNVVSGGGAPGLAFDYGTGRAITGNPIITLLQGRPPVTTGQIALDQDTAERAGYQIGDRVRLVTPGPRPSMTVTLVGIVRFGISGNAGGATLTLFGQHAIQQLFFHGRDVYNTIALTTKPGVSQRQLADSAQKLLSPGLKARTGDSIAAQDEREINKILSFLNDFLLTFAAISLVVGIFLIVNTFSILVAQRSRELALLRAMGASRRQVDGSVLAEALAVGLVGSSAGLGAGYLLAILLRWVFGKVGLDLSGVSMPLAPRTIVAAYLVGLVTTLLAAYVPARRAGRISPVAAMRDDIALPEATLHRRVEVGTGLIGLGVLAAAAGFFASGSLSLIGIGGGALAILVGIALMSAVLGRPVLEGLGVVYRRVWGTVGVLGAQNALRNPRRTAATASALMIGLALVATMTIFGQSAKDSTTQAVNQDVTADFIVSNAFGVPFSTTIARQIRRRPGVQTVAEFRGAQGFVDGGQVFLGAADPRQIPQVLDLPMQAGSVSALNDSTILVSKNAAAKHGYHVGQEVALRLQGGTQHLRVAGIFTGSAAVPAGYIVTLHTLVKGSLQPQDELVFVNGAPGVSTSDLQASISPVVRGLPTISLEDKSGFAGQQGKQIDQFLDMIYALLAFSVLIAALGIVNTLALSVIERTREVGLLRAVGVSRRQLRRMVRLESIAIALLGAVLGVAVGIAFGAALVTVLHDRGLTVLTVPWPRLGVMIVLAGVIGVLAAWLPARRAARLNVLRAIAAE